jgi:hypothetical protein
MPAYLARICLTVALLATTIAMARAQTAADPLRRLSDAFSGPDANGTGYEPDPPEQPGTVTHVARFRAFLPAFKDLSASFPPPGDQGRQQSCVAWSVGYALRGYYQRRGQSVAADAGSLFSPAFIYNQLSKTPDCSHGGNIRAALELMRSAGIATLADFPYDDRSCTRKPDDSVRQHAAANTIIGFRSFGQNGDIRTDDIKGALLAGDPVEVGLNINNKALSRLRRGEIYDADGGLPFDGHAMVVTGFDDRIQAFKLINSWGRKWADDGFGWITYRAFTANVHAAYVMEAGGAVSRPPPPPAPPPPAPPSLVPPSPPLAGDLPSIAHAIAAAARDFPCSRLVWRPTGAAAATLTGWVAEPSQIQAIDNVLRSAPHGVSISNELRLRPWPQCEALITLSDGVTATHGMSLAIVDHDGTEFEAGSRLILRVKTPDFPSYLYVTYLPASGDAVLLHKPAGLVPQALPPGSVVDLGGGYDPRVFRVGPPFGAEMVVAVATASPLFTDGIPASATERDYLTALRKTLLYKPDPSQPDRVVDASALALTTRDHRP